MKMADCDKASTYNVPDGATMRGISAGSNVCRLSTDAPWGPGRVDKDDKEEHVRKRKVDVVL